MSEDTPRVICIGEALIEMTRGPDGAFTAACVGDSFNTAVYLARAGLGVGFATAVGDDPYSDSIVALALAEGLGANLILRVPGRLPALSLVEPGRSGERVTRVWGDGAPARQLFELSDWMRIAQSLVSARLIYFSGITLSLYSNNGLGRLFAALEVARQQGAKIAFDGNFRPAGWKGNLARTRTVFMEALKRVDIALPAFDDEAVLWGDPSPESTVARLHAFGVGEIVVKNGPNSALVATSRGLEFVPVPEILVPVDATAAGDGFNAGYLAARGPAASLRRRQVRRTGWLATSSVIRARCCRAALPRCIEERGIASHRRRLLNFIWTHEKFRGASLARSGIRAMEGEKIPTLAAAARSGGVL